MWAVGVGFMWLNEKGKGRCKIAAMRQIVGFMASWAVHCELAPDR